jgi:atlastin
VSCSAVVFDSIEHDLLVFFQQYKSINFLENQLENSKNWMGGVDEPLRGFSWKSGSKRDTTGIILWSDVFLHTKETNGEKFAIVVMDTQGLFDNQTTSVDNSRIFALSTLISSVQVLNLSMII